MNQYFDEENFLKLNSKIKKKNLFVDSSNANSVINDIIMQLNIIESSLSTINTLLTKAVYKKYVSSNYNDELILLAKKSNNQLQIISKFVNKLDLKYSNDCKDYAIKQLDDRIVALEEKISSLLNK
jgi:hypothetical protein